jgi:hypothetical protein
LSIAITARLADEAGGSDVRVLEFQDERGLSLGLAAMLIR